MTLFDHAELVKCGSCHAIFDAAPDDPCPVCGKATETVPKTYTLREWFEDAGIQFDSDGKLLA